MLLSNVNRVLHYFQNKNNKTPLYSYLTDKLLEKKRIEEAEKICGLGQRIFPDDAVGKYIQTKIDRINDDQQAYFANLEECIQLDNGFLQAYYDLLTRGKNILPPEKIKHYYQKLSRLNFADPEFLENYELPEQIDRETEAETAIETEETTEKSETKTKEEGFASLRISRKTLDDNDESDEINLKVPVPTITFVEILMKQELYDQALEVLDIIEKKKDKDDLVQEKREAILKLKKQSRDKEEE